jgi:hypothetical protein
MLHSLARCTPSWLGSSFFTDEDIPRISCECSFNPDNGRSISLCVIGTKYLRQPGKAIAIVHRVLDCCKTLLSAIPLTGFQRSLGGPLLKTCKRARASPWRVAMLNVS